MKNMICKGVASLALSGACMYWMYLTKGNSGIGWLILGFIIIWSS